MQPIASHVSAARLALFAACAAVVASCDGGGNGSFVVFHSEIEPNDDPWNADFVASVLPGDRIVVFGDVGDAFPDAFDGFAFHAPASCDVRFALESGDAHADLDLAVYDPILGDFVLVYDSALPSEAGAFTVLGSSSDFHLVVYGFAGASSYELSVEIVPAGAAARSIRAGTTTAEILAQDSAGAAERASGSKPGSAERLRGYAPEPEQDAEPRASFPIVRGALIEIPIREGQPRVHRLVAIPADAR